MIEAIQKNPLVAAVTLIISIVAFAGSVTNSLYTRAKLTDLVESVTRLVEENIRLTVEVRRVQEDIRRAQTSIQERVAGISSGQQSFDKLRAEHRWLADIIQNVPSNLCEAYP